MLKGFRDFILRGNVVDLAVAVIIGAAFGAITTSLVTDVITPLLAATVGKPNFSYLEWHVGTGIIKYGNFLNAAISFLLIASVVYFFVVVPTTYLLKKFNPPPPADTKACPECKSDIPMTATRCKFCTQPVSAS
ncbi:large conductance mechanosensitive channel protein MscL [Terriglobus tenax]|uniref:large conductance mechanosensitive channel protein MscL n=1 Tax=Terriglobus tenax TaxID=1111115 RepID=UPI0021E02B92|nr:large conductance mechanosensitive channel protein MscL [Terriglobus tenax]